MIKFLFPLPLLFLFSCDKAVVVPTSVYDCELSQVQAGDSHPNAAEFNELIDKGPAVTTGVQVSVTSADGTTWTGARGFADIPNGVALEPCHRLMAASVSKIVTATLVMQLQDEGVLDLDDLVSDWLEDDLIGELANAQSSTLRELMGHTSGIPDYLNSKQAANADNRPFLKETQREKLRYAYGVEALFAPGEEYSYSNTNFVLLGLVVEKARSQPLWDVIRDQIATPLNLRGFAMGTEQNPLPDDVARPYIAQRGGRFVDVTATAASDAATGDGGIISNTQDLNIFIESLFSGRLISAGALEEMITNVSLVPDFQTDFRNWPDEAYGLGITRYNTPWGIAYGHTGATSSYNAALFHFPESGATLSYAGSGFDLERLDELNAVALEIREGFMALLHD